MSHRPINEKRAARARKALSRRTPKRRFDAVKWLLDRRYVQTKGAARDLILAGRLKSESHTVGIAKELRLGPDGEPRQETVVDRFLPIEYRKNLRVTQGGRADNEEA